MKNLIPVIIVVFMTCASCSHSHKDHSHDKIEESNKIISENISLNNDERWKVNEEMKPFIRNGENLISQYLNNNNNDYQKLATELENENSNLIKSCTMEGKSHEELHKWLHPHLELVRELQKQNNSEAARLVVNKIKDSYTLFYKYFN